MSVSPGTNFTHTITLDLSVGQDQNSHPREKKDELNSVERAKSGITLLGREMEDWILTALVAIGTAASAAWIEFVGGQLADLRFGFCAGMIWLHRDFCCGSASAVDLVNNRCHSPVQLAQLQSSRLHEDPISPFSSPPLVWLSGEPGNLLDHPRMSGRRATWISWSEYLDAESLAPLVDGIFYLAVGTALAGFAAVLCSRIAPAAGGSGIPELKTIMGGFSLLNVMSPWTLCIKIVALAMAVASGLGLGKEGPMVHVGGAWAENFTKIAAYISGQTTDATRRNALLSAGSAAGVSTAFGAPVGGVLFALEEVSTYFPPSTLHKTLFCAVVSSLFLKNVNPNGSGNGTVFQLDAIAMQGRWEFVELIPFCLLAVIGGVVGALFIHLSTQISLGRAKIKRGALPINKCSQILTWICGGAVREVLVVAFAASAMNLCHPMLRVSSTFLMTNLFTRCAKDGIGNEDVYNLCNEDTSFSGSKRYSHNLSSEMFVSLFLALLLYFINALFTSGLMVPAGLFVPCLTIGSLVGRILGLVTIRADHAWHFMKCQDCIHPGVYSLLGAVAVLGGVTRMTVSLVVIAAEMTGGMGYIVPCMMVTLVARWVAEFIVEPSIYDVAIRQKRYPFLHVTPLKADHEVAFRRKASEVMTLDVVCVSLAKPWSVAEAKALVKSYRYSNFPVVVDDETRVLKGFVVRRKLLEMLKRVKTSMKTFVSFEAVEEPDDVECGAVLDFSSCVETAPLQMSPEVSLLQVHHTFLQLGLSFLLFTDEGRLRGILTKKAFLSRLEKLRESLDV